MKGIKAMDTVIATRLRGRRVFLATIFTGKSLVNLLKFFSHF